MATGSSAQLAHKIGSKFAFLRLPGTPPTSSESDQLQTLLAAPVAFEEALDHEAAAAFAGAAPRGRARDGAGVAQELARRAAPPAQSAAQLRAAELHWLRQDPQALRQDRQLPGGAARAAESQAADLRVRQGTEMLRSAAPGGAIVRGLVLRWQHNCGSGDAHDQEGGLCQLGPHLPRHQGRLVPDPADLGVLGLAGGPYVPQWPREPPHRSVVPAGLQRRHQHDHRVFGKRAALLQGCERLLPRGAAAPRLLSAGAVPVHLLLLRDPPVGATAWYASNIVGGCVVAAVSRVVLSHFRGRLPHKHGEGDPGRHVVVVLFGLFHPLHSDNSEENALQVRMFVVAWLFLFTASSLYTWVWDVTMDWGLGRPQFKFLGDSQMFSHKWVYYAAIVGDLFLRFAWTLTLIPPRGAARWLPLYLQPFTMVLELFRRTFWSFFRLENEHLRNTQGFRRVDFIPLHYDHGVGDVEKDGGEEVEQLDFRVFTLKILAVLFTVLGLSVIAIVIER
ncbi:hypothetical protein ON010_g17382 [Phytophthora cinnamomi]|nr:hypothetical protein ON010_g17382 [Phytophthora cinnamomi]